MIVVNDIVEDMGGIIHWGSNRVTGWPLCDLWLVEGDCITVQVGSSGIGRLVAGTLTTY